MMKLLRLRRQRRGLRGNVDRVRAGMVEGWAFDPAAPDRPRCLEVWSGPNLLAVTVADRFREDLRAAGIGAGGHAFMAAVGSHADGRTICVRDMETGWVLPGSAPWEPDEDSPEAIARIRQARAVGARIRRSLARIHELRELRASLLRDACRAAGVIPDVVPPDAEPVASPAPVIVLPPIDWAYRRQRPQHLSMELARRGHKVFYVATDFRAEGPRWAITHAPHDNLTLVRLRCALPHPVINVAPASEEQARDLADSLGNLLNDAGIERPVYLIGNPFWLSVLPKGAHAVIYDCMDFLGGFSATGQGLVQLERRLVREADAVVVSAASLAAEVAQLRPRGPVLTLRNAAHRVFFDVPPRLDQGRRTIGYVGAIEDWFNSDLVLELARRNPAWTILLAGNVGASQARLRAEAPDNVRFLGEVSFEAVPSILQQLDVGLIPFRRTALTHHTNPVKVYEYLAAGLPVVATPMPELDGFPGHVAQADGVDAFEGAVIEALSARGRQEDLARRMAVLGETWDQRGSVMSALISLVASRTVGVAVGATR